MAAFHRTHDIANQPPPVAGHNAWLHDPWLAGAVTQAGGGWIADEAAALGAFVGSVRMRELADDANRNASALATHDARGHRIDEVRYHPAYHELMAVAFGAGLHSRAWTAGSGGGFAARAALNYLWNQGENGTSCPITMSFAAVQVLNGEPALAETWLPRLLASAYDPVLAPVAAKRSAQVGMAMTEKQGGSDLRATATTAADAGDGWHALTGHKWFCSAPMSDAFLTLARRDEGVTCFLVPRVLPDGTRNAFALQRLKDKVGNRSNASAEVEYDGTLAQQVGEPGRGVATLIEMAHLTRFDIVVAVAGMMRGALDQALHHARHRNAFGRALADQPLMRNVLADLAIEAEAALLLALRLARAFDLQYQDDAERALTRILTPVAKYWLCKRLPMYMAEAMECLGGNGYVEESLTARLYREAPLNGIWEGSGNVICLDVLRALAREPRALEAFFAETSAAAHVEPRISRYLDRLGAELGEAPQAEDRARRTAEMLALAMQANLLARQSTPQVLEAFCRSRLGDEGGRAFGTLPARVDVAAIAARAAPLR
jgi:putative acyl-CoA dehydrogenase